MAGDGGFQAGRIAIVATAIVAIAVMAPVATAGTSGGIIFLQFGARDLCAKGEWWADNGSVGSAVDGGWCVTKVSSDDAVLAAAYSLHELINASLPQPPDFFGFFREATLTTTFFVPSAPPAGTQIEMGLLLNHLIVIWRFDADGIAVIPVGDPIAYVIPPAPPPYFAGAVLGKVAYGQPFQVTVDMNIYGHRIVVQQGGLTVVAATLRKIFAHPDRMIDAGVFLAQGDLHDYAIWSMGPVAFRGVKSPAEATITAVVALSQDLRIVRVERLGDVGRVYVEFPAS